MLNKETQIFSEDTFQLPIEFLENKKVIPENLKIDLELEKTINHDTKPIYEYVFNPKTELGKKSLKAWSKYHTTDKHFLKDSQKLYKNLQSITLEKPIINKMLKSWKDIHSETNFLEKFQYIEWEKVKWLNKSVLFLSILSFYNISSPVLQLIAPFFVLIIPFFLIKMMKLPITWNTYYKILMQNIKNHAMGKLFFSFNKAKLSQKVYILVAAGMYIWNIYQNIISCYRFYKNTFYITNNFETINSYLDYTIEKIKLFHLLTSQYKSYDKFNIKLLLYKDKLIKFHNLIRNLPKNNQKLSKITNIGKLMKHFYTLYADTDIENIISYSFGFHGYIDSILGIYNNIQTKKLNACKFSNKITFELKNMHHPAIKNPIKNNINMKKNIIITGPNAAGKTTTIKATIINLLLTQQIGLGFYEKSITSTFDYIHCYLNIPDSSSRDSLFQAEARRCKNILESIQKNPNKKHFCIFDELYSGTNPYEAISSAYSYLKYISENKNVRFLLTTHYIKVCKLFKKEKNIANKSMKTTIGENGLPNYSYKINNGISNIKGGVSVLINLKYPNKIIDVTKNILSDL